MVVKGGIPAGDALEPVVEVDHDLPEGHVEEELHPIAIEVILLDEDPPLSEAELDDRTDVVHRRDDRCADIGLLDVVDLGGIRETGGIVYLHHVPLSGVDHIGDVGDRGDDGHIVLTVEPLLDDLHMEQPEETAPEAKAEGSGALGGEGQGGVIEPQLIERGTEVLVVLRRNGIDTSEDHRLYFLKALDRSCGRTLHRGDGVAHLDLPRVLDPRDDVAHVSTLHLLLRHHIQLQSTHLIGIVLGIGLHEFYPLTGVDRSIHHLIVGNDPSVGIEHGVKDESLQRSIRITHRCGDLLHDGIKYLLYTHSGATTGEQDILPVTAQEIYHLIPGEVDIGTIEVNLIEHRDDRQVVLDRHIEIGDRLRLHPL